MKYDKNNHACYLMEYHLVIVTKYRHKVLINDIEQKLKELTYIIFETYWGCAIEELECNMDHIHILFKAYPQLEIAKLINNYKTVTSRILKRDYHNFLKKYYWKNNFWSRSYFICTVGKNARDVVQEYIRNQKTAN